MNSAELMSLALEACNAAVEVHREHLGQVHAKEWSEKGTADFVTRVDREAEERIVTLIRSRHPDHAILAEEGTAGPSAADEGAEWRWIIDPLDGTTNYLHQYPAYAASVAVMKGDEPVAGAVVDGATGDAWTAYRGGGAFLNSEPITVSEVDRLSHALIGTGFPFKARQLLPTYTRQFEAVLVRTAGVRRAGSAALDLCHVATGYFDGFWELDLAPWDYAAGALIVREAGGLVTALDGELDLTQGGSVLAGNPTIYEELKALLGTRKR